MNPGDFPPPRRRGRNLHLFLILVLAVLIMALAAFASAQPFGPRLILAIVLAVLAFIPIPILAYRLYSLARSNYSIDRDQLTLTWGLRTEQIPLSEIEWVRPLAALAQPLPLPFFRLPGALLGTRRYPDLGPVEFLASDAKSLLLVATSRQAFAISPASPADFIQEIQRAIEMGSLTPAEPRSVYPSFVVLHAWDSLLARVLWLAGFFVNVGLLVWVGLVAPSLAHISLGFQPSGAARPPTSGLALILLPIVSIFLYLAGWVSGLMIYRSEERRPLAYILWISGVVSSLLFLVAVLVIVITPA
ncbi:MAG: PH domain-containing protein [Anaerolineales bacterium]